ncbi:rhodanese-like protein [Leptospira broomii serovar Hurstbridge str. 5399]|uniref:Rhodanese-like protein n=1 Tax=Leptospira broomii serovar Hurstbridge str. 5399 TaxID=1049789 RepID=T0EXD9_9LEPT|nr:rhodanese-like domain-containing protein [Leptospira broomii]EQA43530.1 rhodanese-like protein [Leptospira broomii serovar Hurstbridge str. 5399]
MNNDKLFLSVIVLLTTMQIGCGKNDEGREIPNWLEQGALVVDVRTPQEFAVEHYPGAINIPINDLHSHLGELGPKQGKIILYCQSGGRSARAKTILKEEGFTEVRDAGGIRNLFSVASQK